MADSSNVRELLRAAESGDVSRIKESISSGDTDVQDEEGSTLLMYASANGVEKVVRSLIQAGLDVDQQNHYGWTALLQASCYGHHEVVYTLLQSNADINKCNDWGVTPLVAAAQGGFTTVVQVLLEKGATVATADEVPSITPLMAAAQCGNEVIVKLLLDGGANPNTRYMTIGWTALMFATLNNHAPVIKVLLSRGAVREMRDVKNQRAIDLASSLGLLDVAAILSEDVTAAPSSNIDIFEAVKQEDVEMLKEVIKEQKVSVTVTDKDGATPLMYAARKGNVKVCQVLLDYGADCDAQDQIHRWTAFMHAVHHGHYKIAKLLAEYGANVNLRAKNGSSAFDIANLIGDTRTIHLIAEVTIQRLTEKKETPTTGPEKETSIATTESPPTVDNEVSSQSDGGDNEVFNILRRVSNAYLASGSTNMPSRKDLVRAGSLSPYSPRSLSPELEETAETKGSDSDCNPLSTSKPALLPPKKTNIALPTPPSPTQPTVLKIPERNLSTEKPKKQQNVSSFKAPSAATPTNQFPSRPKTTQNQFSRTNATPTNATPTQSQFPTRKPNLRLTLSPFTTGETPSNKKTKDSPHIKSPRSLPSDTFKFLKKPPSSTPSPTKGGVNFPRSSAKYKLSPNFSSNTDRPPKIDENESPGNDGRPNELNVGGKKSRNPFSMPTAKAGSSFNKIKLPSANYKGLDLKSVLSNASLGQYYAIFEEEEIDINSFLTLSDHDLVELGLSNTDDRKKAMEVISQLNEQPPPPRSPLLSPKPHQHGFGNFKFQ